MRNNNLFFVRAKAMLRRMRQLETDHKKRDDLDDILDQIDRGIYTYEKWIEEAKMIGVRNPAFDGDYVGWLDDDVEDDDEHPQKPRKP